MAIKLSELPKPLLRNIISYLEPKCIKLSDTIIHKLSKYILENFFNPYPHVFITHHYIKTSGIGNCYKLYLFVGDNYNNTDEDSDEDSDEIYKLYMKDYIYKPVLKRKINYFLKQYGIYTDIEFKKIPKRQMILTTEVYCKEWEYLQDGLWEDGEIIDNIFERDSELVSGTYYEMTFSNMVKIKKDN